MAQHQPRERFLGYLNPEPRMQQQQTQDYPTGQFIPPSLSANPEITVNSSISSAPYPVVTGGDLGTIGVGSGTAVAATTATTAAATVPSTTAATAGNTAAATIGTVGTTAATAATPVTVGAVSVKGVNGLTPTISSAATPSPTLATNPALTAVPQTGMASSTQTTGTTTTAASTVSNTAVQRQGRLVIPTSASMSAPLPLAVTTSNGQIVISNVTARARAVRP